MDWGKDSTLEGFAFQNDDGEEESYNRPSKKGKGGGFQSMGLSYNVLKGITKRGYKIPTPIQRKTVPLILDGRDVVAMARTGSGKTACFLIPLFEKLKAHSAKAGARALILAPTRELATQTFKFIKELGRFTGLRAVTILGGDSMENQFSAIHGNPDIIVATPGRFLHICVEMELKLNSVEYVVFDEADRLFEMGFGEQLKEICNRLPQMRQTVLFSATLPKLLVEFTKAGLHDPTLIRLDLETKIPDELKLEFFTCRNDEKLSALLVLLKQVIDQDKQVIVFAATKYHVEYLHMVLEKANIENTYIFSSLDPSARKINTAKFNLKKVRVLIVTDIAARGIDIPQLDYVINYHFTNKAKLFVHRVGRCARAGRIGTAYSLVSSDEYAHLLDLFLFLGRPLHICGVDNNNQNQMKDVIGKIPPRLIEEQQSILLTWHKTEADLSSMVNVCENAYKKYIKIRTVASVQSNQRIKKINFHMATIHPLFKENDSCDLDSFLQQINNYRPNGTTFEICGKTKSKDYLAMKNKRMEHKSIIESFRKKTLQNKIMDSTESDVINIDDLSANKEDSEDENLIEDTFRNIILPKKRKNMDRLYKKKKQKIFQDNNYFVPYAPNDQHIEDALAVNNDFSNEISKMECDLIGDSDEQHRLTKMIKKWDRKKKKFVCVELNSKQGRIKTESGQWISSTYKSNKYQQWKEKSKINFNENEEEEQNNNQNNKKIINSRWAKHNEKIKNKNNKQFFKTNEQILKARLVREKKKHRQKKGRKGGKKK